ncbi:MAG TPA: SMP-30/gluconolactonase/LRE family protein [Dongiaceae bacterium]|jgi:gluconolactonase|nr:SMP-30/gluconolactonase/LRE family protein [Dongiaceae bacterium]
MTIECIDSRFARYTLFNATLEKLHTGMRWVEGPVFFGDHETLLWSDIPNNRILRWTEGAGVSVFRAPSHYANGNTRDRQGRLVTCEHGNRRVTRTEHDGSITVLADRYQGKRLNSPNDVVVKSDDSIWFTDPIYGIATDYEGERAESEIGACHVYRIDPLNGALSIVADDFECPNGLCFSPDEKLLYISDTGAFQAKFPTQHIRIFSVRGATLGAGRVFAKVRPGVSDGFRCDEHGNLWTSAGDGVHCYAPDGTLLGKILVPEIVSNLTFGGRRRNRLFITATTSLYSIYLNTRGAR